VKQLFKRIFGGAEPRPEPTPPPVQESKPRRQRAQKETKSAKELATERGEPYVSVVSVELDPDNIGAGAFELDWNDKFLANLIRAGYQYQPNEAEHVIVDRWFQTVCRNIIMENYEQEQADPEIRRINRKDLGKGRTEIS